MTDPGSSPYAGRRRILIRGVNWLGDAVMTLPALQRLRERFPGVQLTVLTHQKLLDLWKACPSVDSVRTFFPGESPFAVGRRLRSEGFETALVLPNSPRSALEAWWAGIPQRIGYGGSWRKWLLTRTVGPRPGRVPMRKRGRREVLRLTKAGPPGAQSTAPSSLATSAHQVNDHLFLAAALGADPEPVAPRLTLDSVELEATRGRLLAECEQGRRGLPLSAATVFLGANPAAAYGSAKRWPAENFAATMREISGHVPEAIWVLFGDRSDEQLCSQTAAAAKVRVLNVAGKTTLRELMGLLAACRVLLTNDSGPMHLAAALSAPVVVPFGSTSPGLTGPGLPGDSHHRVLSCGAPCAPCFRRSCPIDLRCLTGIGVEQVVSAFLECLQERQ